MKNLVVILLWVWGIESMFDVHNKPTLKSLQAATLKGSHFLASGTLKAFFNGCYEQSDAVPPTRLVPNIFL